MCILINSYTGICLRTSMINGLRRGFRNKNPGYAVAQMMVACTANERLGGGERWQALQRAATRLAGSSAWF